MIATLCAYFLLLLSINLLSIIRWKHFGVAEKAVAILIGVTVISEALSTFASYRWHNNLTVYHIYSPVEFFLISLYFNYSIVAFRKRNIGVLVGASGVIFSLFNTLFIQRITTINSYFLLFEGTAIIIYCLLSFHQILMDEEQLPYRFAHFWITICFLIYWSSTFTGWGIYTVLHWKDSTVSTIFNKVLAAANFTFYLGIGLVFLRYKKLIPSGA
jgi:hypothetical protein